MINENLLSHNIKKFRKRRGLSQAKLANLLYVSFQTVSKWETGASFPDISNLCALANVLGVSIDSLLNSQDIGEKECFFIGIDGGGSKTEFVLFKEDGTVLKRLVLSGTNPNICGFENTCNILSDGIDELLSLEANVSGIYAGIAGAGSGNHKEKITNFLKKKYAGIMVNADSDIGNVIFSVRGVFEGISVIWGTGINVTLFKKDFTRRFGGWGYLFENFGSGYAIGNAVLRKCLACHDGLDKKSLLVDMAEEKLCGPINEKLAYIYSRGKDYVASFAPVAFEAYKKGDVCAKKIISENIEFLAKLINKAASQSSSVKTAIIAGGLTVYNDILIKHLSENLNSDIKIIIPQMAQVFGACLSCLYKCNKTELATDIFEENFKKSYFETVKKNTEM